MKCIVWFCQDLPLTDNPALLEALRLKIENWALLKRRSVATLISSVPPCVMSLNVTFLPSRTK
ncbi:MAG: deoxyribodipyrimidine photo-lyase [Candidatus Paracaedibacteraceae bacterium]|nr:deoxyribodipyrimidine photo-lyase [Candidatus Paracaedibacteraceae bacterium]